jgi:hypothetical protein
MLRLRRPLLVIIVVSCFEDDLKTSGKDYSTRAIFFLFAPRNRVFRKMTT